MIPAVINLKTRPDRLIKVTEELHKFGISDFELFAAHSQPEPLRGNAQSHYDLLTAGHRLIFEDDVYFEGNIYDLLIAALQLPKDFDILYLGGNVVEPIKHYSEHLHRCTAAWGSFAILYSEKGRQYVLNNYKPNAAQFTIYDEWLRVHSKRDLQAYILSRPIAWTRGGYSDVNGKIEDYEPQMRKNAQRNII